MPWTTLGTVSPGDVLRANSGTAAYNSIVGNLTEVAPFFAAWTAYTPVWTNLTVGNATNTGRYVQVGQWVVYQGQITWGSTTTATGSNTTVSLPVTAKSTSGIVFVGSTIINDTGTRLSGGSCYQASATTMIFVHSLTGAGVVNGTSPQTWATGDLLAWQVAYEAA